MTLLLYTPTEIIGFVRWGEVFGLIEEHSSFLTGIPVPDLTFAMWVRQKRSLVGMTRRKQTECDQRRVREPDIIEIL